MMRTGKGFKFWLLSIFMIFCLPFAVCGGMRAENFLLLCENGTAQQVRDALRNGANPNADFLGMGTTALILAAGHNTPEVISILLKAGADVNAKDMMIGGTALMHAVMFNKNPEVASILLKAGSDVNAKNKDGCTVLMLAAGSNPPEVILTLLKAGADVNAKNIVGNTALMWAAGNVPEVISLLLDAGADVNAKDLAGETVLIKAARSNKNPEVISLLLKAGAGVNAKNNKGKTALDMARESEHMDAARILEEAKHNQQWPSKDQRVQKQQEGGFLRFSIGLGIGFVLGCIVTVVIIGCANMYTKRHKKIASHVQSNLGAATLTSESALSPTPPAQPTSAAQPTSQAHAQPEPETMKLTRQGMELLKQGDFDAAEQCFDRILKLNPKNPNAYTGKLMLEHRAKNANELVASPTPLEDDELFKTAMKYAGPKLKTALEQYVRINRARIAKAKQKAAASDAQEHTGGTVV